VRKGKEKGKGEGERRRGKEKAYFAHLRVLQPSTNDLPTISYLV
jgi:hypothetical protein